MDFLLFNQLYLSKHSPNVSSHNFLRKLDQIKLSPPSFRVLVSLSDEGFLHLQLWLLIMN